MVDGGSGDIPRSNQGNEGNKISRRDALKLGGLVAGAFALGEGLRIWTSGKGQPANAHATSVQPSVVPETSQAIPTPTETPVKKESTEDLFKKVVKTGPLFRNCSDAEKEIALKIVKGQVEHYEGPLWSVKKIISGDRTKNTLVWKDKIESYYDEIKDDIEELGYIHDPEVLKQLALSLIFVESGGDKNAVSKRGAKGLCQLMPDAADQAAKRLGIRLQPKDLFDPKTNIQLGLLHLSRLLYVFHDPGLALWVYHLGEGNMVDVIEAHMNRPEYKHVFSKVSAVFRGKKVTDFDKGLNDKRAATAKVIDNFSLNYVRLINDPVVKNWLKENEVGDVTEMYVPRVAAANFFIKNEERERLIQESEKGKKAASLQKHLNKHIAKAA